jgi:DNA-binding beta-propeller fold protein YncE
MKPLPWSVASLSEVVFQWLTPRSQTRRSAVTCLLVISLLFSGTLSKGQTAHFSRAQVTIGGNAFNAPIDLAFDRNGNLFIAEYDGTAIDEIQASNGVIPTLATVRKLATGLPLLPRGVAVDGSGNVFVSEGFSNTVQEIVAVNGSIPASPTIRTLPYNFSSPDGLAVDTNGNVFVADSGHSAVIEMLAVNGTIPISPTVITLGSGFSGPYGLAFDLNGNLFVADNGNQAIKELIAVNGTIPASPTVNTVVTGVFAVRLEVDPSGDIIFSDGLKVNEVLAVGGIIPPSPTIKILIPQRGDSTGVSDADGVAIDAAGNVFVADIGSNHVVRESVFGHRFWFFKRREYHSGNNCDLHF